MSVPAGEMSRTGGILSPRKFLQKRKNDLVYLLALLGVTFCRGIPHDWGVWLGGFLGGFVYYLLPAERLRALQHLRIAFSGEKSPAEIIRIAKGSFRHMGKNAVEMVNLSRIRKDLDRRVTLEGREYLDSALARGRGVLWLTAHLGNWEMIGCYMARLGYPVNVVARAIYDDRLNRLLLKYREEASVRVILRDSPAAGRMILQALKKGEILGMLIDQDTKVKGVMADFFGKRANTPSGPAILAVRRSVPVVAGFIHRISDVKHHIVIYPEVEISKTGEIEKDVQTNTQRFNQLIEMEIRRHPSQWVWVHRRWRRKVAYDPSEEWKVHLNH
jgi:Kdo2-lipid IVA lauroyltransferase/acyltransferase